ncbi:MAG TPA: SMP-30/gluconolactonase/LRE family protein [Polyangia bacterium]
MDGPISPEQRRTIGEIYCATSATPHGAPIPTVPELTRIPIDPPGGISFLEGPVWIARRGVLLFSEWNAGHRILQYTPPRAVEVFMPATGSNGLALMPDGESLLMVTEPPAAGVTRVSLADRRPQALTTNFGGQSFVQPNDLIVRADGTIYFTDYQAGRVYRRTVAGVLSLVASHARANGVALSPDERTLYVNADTRTIKYPLSLDGSLGQGVDFASGLRGADGLAIDCAGNVYVAQNDGGAIVVLSATGSRLGVITGLPRVVTNAAFGDGDGKTLYITTSSALYALRTQVPGLPH